jgi:transposase
MVSIAARPTGACSSAAFHPAMFRLDSRLKVFLHREAVDGRKSINGLALLVEQGLGLDPFAQVAYVFSNRRRDRIKILLWDRNGFWLLIKRLEADRFKWPKESELVELSVEQLHWLLEGINLSAMQPHPTRNYQRVG